MWELHTQSPHWQFEISSFRKSKKLQFDATAFGVTWNGTIVRILHLADHSIRGGASRAAYRLHLALVGEGSVESSFLGLSREWLSMHPELSELQTRNSFVFVNPTANRLALLFRHFLGSAGRLLFDFFFFRNKALEEQLRHLSSDLYVVHWVRPRDVPLRSLRTIDGPIAIVLHDARFLIGHRHYPKSGTYRHRQLSCSETIFARLMRYSLASLEVTLICPSEWMSSLAHKCGWVDHATYIVPYPIDLDFWAPAERTQIERDSQVFKIGFGYSGQGSGYRKGEDLLFGALKKLENRNDLVSTPVIVYLFGDAAPPIDWNLGGTTTRFKVMGNLSDEELRDLYRLIDLVVVPSREENLAQVALEAQATGTPALVSSSTGLESTICSESGQVFKNGSATDLAQKIFQLIQDMSVLEAQAISSRKHALREFSNEAVARKFIDSVSSN